MPRIGIHTSIAGSLAGAAEKAAALGCDAFQIFSASPRQWRAARLEPAAIHLFRATRERLGLAPLVIHTNYLVNLAAADPVVRSRSIAAFRDELRRAIALGADYLVLHPGSHRGQALDQALRTFARSLTRAPAGCAWTALLADPRLRDKTLILETPVEKPGDDRRNVRALRFLATGAKPPNYDTRRSSAGRRSLTPNTRAISLTRSRLAEQ